MPRQPFREEPVSSRQFGRDLTRARFAGTSVSRPCFTMTSQSLRIGASLGCAIALTLPSFSLAGSTPDPATAAPAPDFVNLAHGSPRADDHAPIGVMGDHLHAAGDWMLGLHWMSMRMDGHREGTDRLSSAEVFERTTPNGSHYGMAAKEMTMDHLMAHVMFAPTDWLTLMAMPQYVWTDMDMVSSPRSHGAGHGPAAMPGMTHAGHGAGHGGNHSHATEGLGDLPVVALFPLWRDGERDKDLHAGLGVSIPTGAVDARQDGAYLPYDMQIGSGTWDLLPSLTWTQRLGRFGYGAQISATVPLYPDENGAGYRRGETYQATGWLSFRVADWVSLSARLAGTRQNDIAGHYNGAHDHSAPNHFQPNFGGDFVDFGLGANFVVTEGLLRGHRFGVELLLPVHQDANGVGMNREWTLGLGWSKAF